MLPAVAYDACPAPAGNAVVCNRHESRRGLRDGRLVSLFDGKNHGSADNIWEDLCGENDITDLMANSSTGVGFTEEGWHSVNSKHAMPAALLDVLKGKEYTFEMVLGGVTMNGTSYATLIANNGGTSNEKFALYVQKSDGIFYAKASGLTRTTTPPCPHVEDGLNIVANSTVTVTFKENGSVNPLHQRKAAFHRSRRDQRKHGGNDPRLRRIGPEEDLRYALQGLPFLFQGAERRGSRVQLRSGQGGEAPPTRS